MSKPKTPENGEASDSDSATSVLKTEKDVKSNLQTQQSGLQPEKPAEVEIGGQAGPEPTRFGDWEKNGRCTDF